MDEFKRQRSRFKGGVLVELALVLLLLIGLISAIIDTAWVIRTADLAKEAVRYHARIAAANGDCDSSGNSPGSVSCNSTPPPPVCNFLQQAGLNLSEWNYQLTQQDVGLSGNNGVTTNLALINVSLTYQGSNCVFCLRRFFSGAVPQSAAVFLVQNGQCSY